MTKPHGHTTVSVALRTHNASATLDRLLQSLAAQKQLPTELVVIDDASSDDSVVRLERFAEHAPFAVRIVRYETPRGRGASYSDAISHCSGEVIALCDQEDIWAPRKILVTSKAFDLEPDIGIAFGDARLLEREKRHLWDALEFTPDTRRGAIVLGSGNIPANNPLVRTYSEGRLIPVLVTTYLAPGNRVAFRSKLRDVLLPIPLDDVEGWTGMIAALRHPFRLITEPLVTSRTPIPGRPNARTRRVRIDAARRGLSPHAVNERRNARRREADLLEGVAERLNTTTATELRAQASHLRARGTLPAQRRKRLEIVLRELRSGRYTRYGTGRISAIQDILV